MVENLHRISCASPGIDFRTGSLAGSAPSRQCSAAIAGGFIVTVVRVHREPRARRAQLADAELAEELAPASRAPSEPGIGRQRAQIIGLGAGMLVAGLL